MANSLLDFVMSVVRDPDAAAQYAANPQQAIADANLTDVTSADVIHLIPVVAESLSSVMPADTLGDSGQNVWTSGAATAAFDAFDDHLPIQGVDAFASHGADVASVINTSDMSLDGVPVISDGFDGGTGGALDAGSVPSIAVAADDPYVLADAPVFDDVHLVDAAGPVEHAIDDHQPNPQDPGFDIFT